MLYSNFDGIESRLRDRYQQDGIDYITQLPTDLLKLKLCEFLLPYEQFKFARINRHFASIYGIKQYNFKYFNDRDRNCWFRYIHQHYVESGGWLLFKNKKFDNLPSDIRLCLMYFIIHYDEILKHQNELKQIESESDKDAMTLRRIIPKNVNHLRVIQSDNVNTSLTKFVQYILEHSSSMNPINAIYIERCNLGDMDVCNLSNSLIRRKGTSNLRGFSIGGNPLITDQYIELFFHVISEQCPSLRTLGLHGTNITNKSCKTIFNFYANQKKKQKEYILLKEKVNRHHIYGEKLRMKSHEIENEREDQQKEIESKQDIDDRNENDHNNQGNVSHDIVLEKLYLMRNSKITEKGIDILNEIFVKKYLDDTRLEHQVVINCARCGLKSRKDNWNRTIRV